MASIYYGTSIKFGLELTAEGFSMNSDDFSLEATNGAQSVLGNKTNAGTDGNMIVYKDQQSDSWFVILNTLPFTSKGDLKLIATALIPDSYAQEAIRKEIAVQQIGRLINP